MEQVATKRLTKFTPDTTMGTVKPRAHPAAKTGATGVINSGRNKTESLQYPLNVENDPQQGHYIIFEILQQNKAKLLSKKNIKDNAKQMLKAQKQNNAKDANLVIEGSGSIMDKTKSAGKKFVAAATPKKHSGPNSLQVARNATTKMPVCIALYMPPSVQVNYGAKYGEADIGVIAESINAGIQAFMNTGGNMADRMATAGGKAAGGLLSGGINKIKDMMPAGSAAIFAINSGSIITPRVELMFEGIQRRTFSFNFTFIPKSAQEADIVEQIVKKFKYHMSSNYGSNGMGGVDGVREMEIPDFFNIKYMYRGSENIHLNKIKQCVLTSAQIDYGADRWHAFENGQPQTTKLALSFQEMEFITKDYIGEEHGY